MSHKNSMYYLQRCSFACWTYSFIGFVISGQNTAMVVAEEEEEKLEVNATRTNVKLTIGTNVTTLGGKSVTLLCPTKGVPKPRIFWYKDAIELEANDEITFGPNGELILEDVRIEDAGRYTCVAENEFGRDKMSTMVNVAGIQISTIYDNLVF